MPIPVEGGLTAKSKRGQIGDTWWSQRFLHVLESYGLGSRLQRGKRYARSGQVLSMEVAPGSVKASVQGSRTKPYRVFMEAAVLTGEQWDSVESAMATSAVFAARLLAGEMPTEVETAFADSGVTLFPDVDEGIESACSCPDWENPCKHIAAVFYLLAEAFDKDPFLIFVWRGRTKDDLLANLRSRRRHAPIAGDPSSAEPTTVGDRQGSAGDEGSDDHRFGWPSGDHAEDLAGEDGDGRRFWGAGIDPSSIEARPRLAVAPDLVLRELDAAMLEGDASHMVETLRQCYARFTSGAIALAAPDDDR